MYSNEYHNIPGRDGALLIISEEKFAKTDSTGILFEKALVDKV